MLLRQPRCRTKHFRFVYVFWCIVFHICYRYDVYRRSDTIRFCEALVKSDEPSIAVHCSKYLLTSLLLDYIISWMQLTAILIALEFYIVPCVDRTFWVAYVHMISFGVERIRFRTEHWRATWQTSLQLKTINIYFTFSWQKCNVYWMILFYYGWLSSPDSILSER